MAAVDPLNNHAFLYGESLFETFRVLNGFFLFWEEHKYRLTQSASELWKKNIEQILNQIPEKLEDGVYRVTLYQDQNLDVRLHILRREFKPWPNIIRLKLQETVFKKSDIPAHFKLGNLFYKNWIKRNLADEFFDVLYFDEDQNILETSIANVFFVHDKKVITPKKSSLVLDGIGLSNIKKFAKKISYEFIQQDIKKEELDQFKEAYVVNSVRGVAGITSINNFQFNHVDLWNKCFYAE